MNINSTFTDTSQILRRKLTKYWGVGFFWSPEQLNLQESLYNVSILAFISRFSNIFQIFQQSLFFIFLNILHWRLLLCITNFVYYFRPISSGVHSNHPVSSSASLWHHSVSYRVSSSLPVHHLDQRQENIWPIWDGGDTNSY